MSSAVIRNGDVALYAVRASGCPCLFIRSYTIALENETFTESGNCFLETATACRVKPEKETVFADITAGRALNITLRELLFSWYVGLCKRMSDA